MPCFKRNLDEIFEHSLFSGAVFWVFRADDKFDRHRNFLQAGEQLGPGWKLMRQGEAGVPSLEDWLFDNCPEGSSLGLDHWVVSIQQFRRYKTRFGFVLKLDTGHDNLVDMVWSKAQPVHPDAMITALSVDFAGVFQHMDTQKHAKVEKPLS